MFIELPSQIVANSLVQNVCHMPPYHPHMVLETILAYKKQGSIQARGCIDQ